MKDSETIKELEQRIKEAEHEVIRLKRERNSRLPMFHLPAEIFEEIFTHLTPKVPQSLSWNVRNWDVKWLSFTHVCHAWRTIALNHPSLWTCPDWSIPDLACGMIQRSKDCALHVVAMEPGHDVLRSIQSQLARIETLAIVNTKGSSSMLQDFVSSLVQPSPILRSITIDMRPSHQGISFPPHFLGTDAPILNEISLSGCHLPWGSPLLGNITFLELGGYGLDPPSGQQFLDSLRRMPLLQTLRLYVALPPLDGSEAVDLPQLRFLLLIQDCSTSCVGVLKHINFPSTSLVRLQCDRDLGGLDYYTPLWTSLAEKYSRTDVKMTAMSLCVEVDAYGANLFFAWWNTGKAKIPPHCRFSGYLDPPLLQVCIVRRSDNVRICHSDVKAALENATLAEAIRIEGSYRKDLVHEGEDRFSPGKKDLFSVFFGTLLWSTNLKRLLIEEYDWAIQFVYALAPFDVTLSHPSSVSSIPFPSLADLSLSLITQDTKAEEVVNRLTQSLEWRAARGFKLASLCLQRYKGITEGQVAALGRVVGEVRVLG